MTTSVRSAILAGLLLLLGCTLDEPDNSGSAGMGGGAGGTSGGGGGLGAGGGGTSGGGGGSGAGGTSGASCQACLACVMTNCPAQTTACVANTGCNTIYECARGCQTPVNDCVDAQVGNTSAVITWASVSACLNQNCLAVCTY